MIEALEFGREQLLEGKFIDRSDLHNHLVKKGLIRKDTPELRYLIDALYHQIFTINHPTEQFKFSKQAMGIDAYLGLLSYEELQQAKADSAEARKEAQTALKWTKWSLLLATIVGISQIVISIQYN